MNKNKFYLLIIFVLLVLNLALIMVFRKPPPGMIHDKDRAKNIIIKELELDTKQVKEYEVLIEHHRSEIRRLDKKIRNTKNELYQYLSTEVDKEVKDSLLSSIANAQKEIEEVHYNHFVDIREICNEEQKVKFEKLSKELASLFGKRKPRK